MTEETNIEKKQTADDEIDLIEVAMKIWAERRLILKVVAVFFLLGLVVAFGSKKEYKSEVTMITEDNSGGSRMSGMLAQFGGLADINLGGAQSGDVISPELYPNIIHSTTFMLNVLQHEVYFYEEEEKYTLFTYFNEIDKPSLTGIIKGYTIGLPGKILSLFRKKENEKPSKFEKIITDEGPVKLTKAQAGSISKLKNRINIELDENTGIIAISVELPDPHAAAELAEKLEKDLAAYIVEYRTQKALTDLQFIEQQYVNAKQKFETAQNRLAKFRDENVNVVTAKARTKEERLQAEYNLAFNVYNGLAQQLEQAKIEVQEKTPVFKIVDGAKVPLNSSKPRILLILMITLFMAVIFSIGWIIFLIVWTDIKKNIELKANKWQSK